MGKRRVLVVGLVSAVVAALLVGAVWGVSAYRDRQLDDEARDHVAAVIDARSALDSAAEDHATSLNAAKEHQAQVSELTEQLMAARSEYFDGDALDAYGTAVDRLDGLIADGSSTELELEAPFDAEDPERAFIDAYREADAERRETLAAASAETAERLNGRAEELGAARDELTEAVTATRRTAAAIVQKLSATADSLADKYDESADGPLKSLRAAAKPDGWDEVSDEQVAERFGQLPKLVESYTKAADEARKSHDSAVAKREEAARSRSSNDGGRRGPMLCNRFMPDLSGTTGGSLVLVPC